MRTGLILIREQGLFLSENRAYFYQKTGLILIREQGLDK